MATNPEARAQRADARRNRSRVLKVAIEVFGAEGLSVPVHEIARRAGVGTGTVSRHFPTKEALFEAIVRSVAERLVDQARRLAAAEDPGTALFEFLSTLVEEGAANRGLSDAFAGVGFDVAAAASGAGHDVMRALGELLVRAQQAGAVRDDVETADLKALVVGCLARERGHPDAGARARMVAIVCQGLRTGR
jgi:AcrR family transcriptional regulator